MMFLFLIFSACSNEEQLSNEQFDDFRLTFLEGKDFEQQKESFKKLTNPEMKMLWLSKLNSLSKQNLPSDVQDLISQLSDNILKNGFNPITPDKDLIKTSENLFRLVPSTDLKQMFFSLEDYTYPNQFDINSGYLEPEFGNKNLLERNATTSSKAPDCNCSWTCGSDCEPLYCSTRNCNETSWGCGFLWLGSCKKKAIL